MVPAFHDIYFSPYDKISTKLPKKRSRNCSPTKGQPLNSVSRRKCKGIVWFGVWISFSLNSPLSCRALAYFNALRQKDLCKLQFISKFLILWMVEYSFVFFLYDAFSPGTFQNNWKRNQNIPSSPSSSPEESVSSASLPYLMADKNSKAINCEHRQWIAELRISTRRKAQAICAHVLPYLS